MGELEKLLRILNTDKMVLQCYQHGQNYPENIRTIWTGVENAHHNLEKDAPEKFEKYKNAQLMSIDVLKDGTTVVQLDYFRQEEDKDDIDRGIDHASEN